jgi:formate dehydrogenase subunit gamma
MEESVGVDLESSVKAICERHGRKPDELMEILHAVQEEHGFIPRDAVPVIADVLNISRAEVHGVVTYYHDFRSEPAGRCVVKLCRAEACQSVGVEALAAEVEHKLGVKFGETRADGAVTLETVYCFGNCALGPAAMVDGALYGGLTADRLVSLTKKAMEKAS